MPSAAKQVRVLRGYRCGYWTGIDSLIGVGSQMMPGYWTGIDSLIGVGSQMMPVRAMPRLTPAS